MADACKAGFLKAYYIYYNGICIKSFFAAIIFGVQQISYCQSDIHFNKKGNILYATVLGIPVEKISIKSLNKVTVTINRIEMLGSKEKLVWKQYSNRLVIEKPKSVSNDIALVFKIQMKQSAP